MPRKTPPKPAKQRTGWKTTFLGHIPWRTEYRIRKIESELGKLGSEKSLREAAIYFEVAFTASESAKSRKFAGRKLEKAKADLRKFMELKKKLRELKGENETDPLGLDEEISFLTHSEP